MRRITLLGFGLIVLLGVVGVYGRVAHHTAATMPEIRSGITGYCLDDHHDGSSANASVDTWVCNGTAAQNWTVNSHAIRHGKNQCLDVENNGTDAGDKVVLNPCDRSPGETWAIDIGGYQNPASGLCLSAPASKANKQLVVGSCDNLSALGEAWTVATWERNPSINTTCTTGTKGQQVACYAEKQWAAWQAGSPSHKTLLADYTDGNSYEEWCADFVSYVYKEAGYPFENGERGGGWDEYDANNIQNMGFTMHSASGYEPQAGDVAVFDYPGGHVEIVVAGGKHPTFIYGDSNTTDPSTGNGEMNEDSVTVDGSAGQVIYYLSPN